MSEWGTHRFIEVYSPVLFKWINDDSIDEFIWLKRNESFQSAACWSQVYGPVWDDSHGSGSNSHGSVSTSRIRENLTRIRKNLTRIRENLTRIREDLTRIWRSLTEKHNITLKIKPDPDQTVKKSWNRIRPFFRYESRFVLFLKYGSANLAEVQFVTFIPKQLRTMVAQFSTRTGQKNPWVRKLWYYLLQKQWLIYNNSLIVSRIRYYHMPYADLNLFFWF